MRVESLVAAIQCPTGIRFGVHAADPEPKVDITNANPVEIGSNHVGLSGQPDQFVRLDVLRNKAEKGIVSQNSENF